MSEMESIKIQNQYLASEVERLNNNLAYIDSKLDDEMKKSHHLYSELRRLQAEIEKIIANNEA